MGNYNFKEDLILGEEGEKIILDDLISLGAKYQSDNKTNSHDIIVLYNDKPITYECKTDFYRDTGNIFIETECRGKPSGISVTKAKWFVTYFKKMNEIWYIKTEDLKRIIREYESSHSFRSSVGDKGSNTKGYLIKKELFKKDFIIRDPIKHINLYTAKKDKASC